MSYARAPKAARAVLDRTGLESVVESTRAKLAVGRHVVVVGDVGSPDLYQMALIGDLAVDEVDRIDGRHFGGRVLILAPATQDEYRAWGGAGYTDAWGITKVPPQKDGSTWITLDLSKPGLTAATMEDDHTLLKEVIAHEMFHALTLKPGGRARAPLWLIEGFAEVAGERMSRLAARTPPRRATLPTDTQIEQDPYGYYMAGQIAAYIEQRSGRRAMRFYFAAVSPHRRGTLNEISERYLDISVQDLVRLWKRAYRRHGPISM